MKTIFLTMFVGVLGAALPAYGKTGSAKPTAAKEIILYGSKGCGICQGFFRKMQSEGIQYTFRDVDTDNEALNKMWELVHKAKGRTNSVRFPVITVGEKILVSPDYDDFKAALSQN